MGLMAMGGMAALSMGTNILDQKNQGKMAAAQETMRRKQLIEAVKTSNIADASLKLQAVDSYKMARQELENQTMSAIKAKGAVTTAMNESNLEGRSMERVQRDVDNIALRTKGQINENYRRDYHNIWVQRESNRDNLIAQIKGSAPVQMPSTAGSLLSVAQAGVQGALVGQNLWGAFGTDPNLQSNKS